MASAYESVIGLEVHAQMLTSSKLFCGCSTTFGAAPNTQVCPVCLGLPGALPVPNEEAIHLAMRAAVAVGCEVREYSRFARKNYFYPDLAKGYQISQFELPLNEGGELLIEDASGERVVGITRIHVEEDAAKNIHGGGSSRETLVNFNRAGVALIEIVGEPDLRTAEEAESYLRRLREILIYSGVNDGNLEEGSFRCDANVSIRPKGSDVLNTRTELKNINSFRFVKKAIDYEIARQQAVVDSGGTIVQETRTWNENSNRTESMRSKEEAHDYRYFPDPDLPPIVISEEQLAKARKTVPELPAAMRARWQSKLGVTEYDAGVLSQHPVIAALFDEATAGLVEAGGESPAKAGKRVANFIQGEVLRGTQTSGLQATLPVTAEQLTGLLKLVVEGAISGKMAKGVYEQMVETGKPAATLVDEQGLAQVSDTGALEAMAREALDAHASQAEQYRGGNTKIIGFFVGKVMQASKGNANPKLVNEVLRKLLADS